MALAASILSNSTSRPSQSLARRLLFPNHSAELPPLLAAQNAPPELQAELYDLIALALRAHINPWWTKITRYDKEFLPQIAKILTAVVRVLEARALAVDLPALVFQDVPVILAQHYRDYRNAESKLLSSYAIGGAASLPQLFHHLQPHIALSPDGRIDLEYYRQIVDHVLKACLPPEDYAPEVERIIVREVVVNVLVDDVIPKVTQPWFIQSTILDLLGDSGEEHLYKSSESSAQPPSNSFSFHTFIVLVLSALQSFSSTCLALIHAYKQAISTIKRVNKSPSHTPRPASPLPLPLTERSYHEIERPASAQPQHSRPLSMSTTPSSASSASYPSRSVFPPRQTPAPDPNLVSRPGPQAHQHENYISQLLTLFSEIFLTSERLAATTIMTLFAMISMSIIPFLDKLLPHLLYSILSPGFILNLVRLGKRTMFPNGYPGPPPIDPTPEEQAAIRRRLTEWRGASSLCVFFPSRIAALGVTVLFTAHLIPFLLGADPARIMNAAIDPLTCQPCNVHLTVILFDRILLGLFPELIGENTTAGSPITTTNASGNMILHVHGNSDSRNIGENSANTDSTSGMQGDERSSASSPRPVDSISGSGGGGAADDS